MNQNKTDISKFISYGLRHAPEKIGLIMDSNGWVIIDDLIKSAIDNGYDLNYELLEEIVENNDKKRFSMSSDGVKIRANQGHSIDVDVELAEKFPPNLLYHGTASRFIESIKNDGLMAKSRLYVHLSSDYETALKVGGRHGKPCVLNVNSQEMNRDGIKFYLSNNNVWLTKFVDKKYITF